VGDYYVTIGKYPVGDIGILAEVFLQFFLTTRQSVFCLAAAIELRPEISKKNVRGIP
jgi:hypothetical protein